MEGRLELTCSSYGAEVTIKSIVVSGAKGVYLMEAAKRRRVKRGQVIADILDAVLSDKIIDAVLDDIG